MSLGPSMLIGVWPFHLNDGEQVLWVGHQSVRLALRILLPGLIFFGGIGFMAWHDIGTTSTLAGACSGTFGGTCVRFFVFRWPLLIGCGAIVLVILALTFGLLTGLIGHQYALTQGRALWSIRAPWNRGAPRLFAADFRVHRPYADGGSVVFGEKTKGFVFSGIGVQQAKIVVDTVERMTKAKRR